MGDNENQDSKKQGESKKDSYHESSGSIMRID